MKKQQKPQTTTKGSLGEGNPNPNSFMYPVYGIYTAPMYLGSRPIRGPRSKLGPQSEAKERQPPSPTVEAKNLVWPELKHTL